MIETNRLIIRNLEIRDYIEMYKYMSLDEVLKYEQMSPFNLQDLEKFVSDIAPSKKFYSVILKDSNMMIGHLYLGKTNPESFNEYNLGYIFNPDFHNKGFCTEGSKAIITYGFNVLKAHRITAKCNPDNIASWRVMEKIGLQKEGHFKKRVCFKKDFEGNPIYWDELVYGIIKDDWHNIYEGDET